MEKTDLLTADELAVHLHLRASTVRRWAHEGRIPVVRLSPKVVRFDLARVVEALKTAAETGKGVADAK